MRNPVLIDEHDQPLQHFESASIVLWKSGPRLSTVPEFLGNELIKRYSGPDAPRLFLTDGQRKCQVVLRASELALAPLEDKNVYGFEANGKQYELHIYFPALPYIENYYELYEDGKLVGARVANTEDAHQCALRMAAEYGALDSLRNLSEVANSE